MLDNTAPDQCFLIKLKEGIIWPNRTLQGPNVIWNGPKQTFMVRGFYTVYFTDFDQGSKMIIFVSILATFKASVVFRGRWGSSKNWLKLKI